jgi:hypothetical protein
MTGEIHWFPVVLLFTVAGVPLAYLWLTSRREDRKYTVEHGHVRCRDRGNDVVDVTLVRDATTGAPIGIRECSENVQCNRTCLPLFVQADASSSKNQIDR